MDIADLGFVIMETDINKSILLLSKSFLSQPRGLAEFEPLITTLKSFPCPIQSCSCST